MKREGWTAEFIEQKIDEYIIDLPLRDEYIAKRSTNQFAKGALRTDKITDETDKMNRLRAAVNEFENYQKLMSTSNRYDFDDMINWVVSVFEKNISILTTYQEKFQYILIDEFQDTSGTQNKLVNLLINYWAKPNIFVVGDDDQSIYRFQGANVENMLDFASNYSTDLITVVLTNNYRSTQAILDISKTLIDKNKERLVNQIDGLSKDLLSVNPQINGLLHKPVLTEYNSVKEEMIVVTNAVYALIETHVSPSKIAVIYKENKYGTELSQYFQQKKYPFTAKEISIF